MKDVFDTAVSPKRLQELQRVFDRSPRWGKGFDWTGSTVSEGANLMLRYLLQLPESVVPPAFYERFAEPLTTTTIPSGYEMPIDYDMPLERLIQDGKIDLDAAVTQYQALLTELPPLRRQLLLYLLDLFAVFASKSDINNATPAKLAALFQPAILEHLDYRNLLVRKLKSQRVLEFLIYSQDNFLIGLNSNAGK